MHTISLHICRFLLTIGNVLCTLMLSHRRDVRLSVRLHWVAFVERRGRIVLVFGRHRIDGVERSLPVAAAAAPALIAVIVVVVLMLGVLVVNDLSNVQCNWLAHYSVNNSNNTALVYLLRIVALLQIDPEFGGVQQQSEEGDDEEFHLQMRGQHLQEELQLDLQHGGQHQQFHQRLLELLLVLLAARNCISSNISLVIVDTICRTGFILYSIQSLNAIKKIGNSKRAL